MFNVIFSIGGNNPWDIFNISSNANDFALAGSNISEGTEGFYQFTNPALLPKSTNIHYGVSYNMMSLDRSNQVISVKKRNIKIKYNEFLEISKRNKQLFFIISKKLFLLHLFI